MGTILADGFFARGDARAVHQSVQRTEFLDGQRDRRLGLLLVGDVGGAKARLRAQFADTVPPIIAPMVPLTQIAA